MVYNVICLENSLVFKVFFAVNFHMPIKNRTATLIWSVSSPVSIIRQYQSNLYISSSKLLTISPSYGTFLLLNKIVFIPTFLAAPKYPLLSSIYKHSSALTASFSVVNLKIRSSGFRIFKSPLMLITSKY